MPLSPVPALPADSVIDGPWAVTTLDDIPTDTDFGPSASLIYVEGQVALYLDEEDTDLALANLSDRDLKLVAGLVDLALERVQAEQTVRRVARRSAERAAYSVVA